MMDKMELADKNTDFYETLERNAGTPWFRRYKKTIWIIIAIFGVAILTIIIVVSLKCQDCKGIPTPAEPLVVSPSLHWNEECSSDVSTCTKNFQENPPLLLISLDGFRVDYLQYGISPTLSKIAECGVKADFMYPIYPSKTFPNHYTMVTGLYPESHGIIDNQMFDPVMNQSFKVKVTRLDDPRWWQKEPIWVTAQKQGKSAACFFWPGSDVRINGSYPDIYYNYNGSIPYETRVDRILEWLTMPKRPDFLTLYIDQPDKAGHSKGPDSVEVKEAIKNVDGLLDKLFAGLQIRNLTNCVNIIIVSDHGMSEVNCERALDIRKYMNISTANIYVGPFGRIRPKPGTSSAEEIVSKFQCQDSHMRVYRKEELPIRMHYRDNERVEPIIVDIDQRYALVDQDVKQGDRKCTGGNHGYDNISPDMKTIFFAHGPSFKNNLTALPFLNIELYELMSEVLGIIPQPNNGTRGSLHEMLKHPQNLTSNINSKSPPPVAKVLFSLPDVKLANCPCNESDYERVDDDEMIENKTRIHLPFGIPVTTAEHNESLLLLYNSDYIVAYDTEDEVPRWAAFTITHSKISFNSTICWSNDARIPNATCSTIPEGFIRRPLFSPDFSDDLAQSQVFFVTNSLLKSESFVKMYEDEVNNFVEKRLFGDGPVNVITGPVFDPYTEDLRQNLTENSTNTIPSHVFVILTWCSSLVDALDKCDSKQLEVQAFLLPNFPFPHNCENAVNSMKRNGARVREIERIAGITFYSELPVEGAIRLRTSVEHLTL